MTAADLVRRLLPVGALERACLPGLEYLRGSGHRPAAEVLAECLATTAGCAHVRWLAVQAWGQRARDAIHRGYCRAIDVDGRQSDDDFRRRTTGEVAAWLRAEIGGAS